MPSEWFKGHWELMIDMDAFKEYFNKGIIRQYDDK